MKIIFDALGFSSASAFILKDGRQMQYAWLRITNYRDGTEYDYADYDFIQHYVKEGHITSNEIPTKEQTIAEYEKQLAANKGNPNINKKIQYAG